MTMPEICSRKAAAALGLTKYFTGRPCKCGHIAERRVITWCCVQCERESQKKWRAKNPDNVKAWTARYYQKNAEEISVRRRAVRSRSLGRIAQTKRRQRDPESDKLYQRERYRKNPRRYKEYSAKWRRKNPEKIRLQNLRSRERNLEKVKARVLRWKKENPEKCRINKIDRRARIRGALGSFTEADIDRIYKLQSGQCAYCRVELGHKFERDHIIPLALGGTNDARNIQLLCNSGVGACNQAKGGKDPICFARTMGLLL